MKNVYKLLFSSISILLICFNLPAQYVVKGSVYEADTGDPIPYAGVTIVSSNSRTVTDLDGNFSISTNKNEFNIQVSSIGYKTEIIKATVDENVIVHLTTDSKLLEEVIVKSKKKKYRNRNNPAVELIEKVIARKDSNRQESIDYYKNEHYEKIQFALSDIKPDFKDKKVFKKFQFVFENTDSTKLQGKLILPIYLKETLSDYYYSKLPHETKEIVKATKLVSFDGYLNEEGMAEYLKYLYQNINIYNNNVSFLTNQFLSPVAVSAPIFYKYFIMDTSIIDSMKCIKLFFTPRNKTDLLFQGNMYITLDSTYAVKRIEMTVNKDINLNWVKEVKIVQTYDNIKKQGWILTGDEISIDFGIVQSGIGVFGQRVVSYKNFNFDQLNDSVFKGPNIVVLDSALKRNKEYWQKHRHQLLSASESGTYAVMDSVKRIPVFRRTMDIMLFLFTGYKDMGYFEIGPINTFYSYNRIEGIRYRFGGRTTPKLSKKVNFESYIAYGLEDRKYKFYLGNTYSLTSKTIYDFPIKYLKFSYQQDTKIPGQELQFVQEDNFLLSIKRGVNDKMFYNKTFKVEHLNEFKSHFSYNLSYLYNTLSPAGNLFFIHKDYTQRISDVPYLNISEIGIDLRYAPNEQFYQSKSYRTPIANKYPILELQYTLGYKFLKNDYDYHKLKLSVYKRFYLSVLGYSDVIFEAGKVFNRVPYPLLTIHRANQTYSYQILSYNLMNFLEFVSDQYVSLNIDHSFYGFFLNKIPVLKKSKLREVATCKILYGNITDNNNPALHSELFKFPKEFDGTPITYTLEKMPYVEVSIGIANIFKLIRIDIVKRLNYLDHPHVSEYGIRMRFKFDF